MSRLAEVQKGIRDLLKNRTTAECTDPYLQRVAASRGLAAIREIAIWWRAFQLESSCQLTSRLLKRDGIFDQIVQSFYFENAVSPFIEAAGDNFLAALSAHPDPLVAAMAQFERAVGRVKRGDVTEYSVKWDRNPEKVMQSLLRGSELPPPEPGWFYRMRIDQKIPNLVCCFREPELPWLGKSSATAPTPGTLSRRSGRLTARRSWL